MKLVVTIPGTPNKLLAPNKARTVHYMAKAKVSAIMRQDAAYVARAALSQAFGPDVVSPVFVGPVVLSETVWWGKGERRVDLSAIPSLCKPFEDGLTDANVWVDDSQVVRLVVTQSRAADGIGVTILEISDAA